MHIKRLKLVQVARKTLGLDEDSYRAILRDYGGADSATSLDERGFDAVMDRFRHLGFVSTRRKASFGANDRAGMASAAQVAIIRDLWSNLTGADGEAALNRWLDGHFRISALRFLPKPKAHKVIGALRTWEARERMKGAGTGRDAPNVSDPLLTAS